MKLVHHHTEPNTNRQFECKAWESYNKNLFPSDDGLYRYEKEDKQFISTYQNCLEGLEKLVLVKEIETS